MVKKAFNTCIVFIIVSFGDIMKAETWGSGLYCVYEQEAEDNEC